MNDRNQFNNSDRSRFFSSSNPFVSEERYYNNAMEARQTGISTGDTMTVSGAVNKTFILTAILFGTGALAWNLQSMTLFYVGMIGALIAGFVGLFAPKTTPFTAPLYAAFEGLMLGTLSLLVNNMISDGQLIGGIVFQAIFLTAACVGVMLGAYRLGLIRATETFRSVIFTATAAIAVVYLISMLGNLIFGAGLPYIHSNGPIGILFSVVVVGIAAFNLIIDFDAFEQGERYQAPKYMEWASAMGLMFTIVWLYVEILKLLMKLQSRD